MKDTVSYGRLTYRNPCTMLLQLPVSPRDPKENLHNLDVNMNCFLPTCLLFSSYRYTWFGQFNKTSYVIQSTSNSLRCSVAKSCPTLQLQGLQHTRLPCLLLLLLSRFSRVRLCATPEMEAHQTPPSLGFSRQEHWSGLPFPSPMHESEK